jgi:hypothetical protein
MPTPDASAFTRQNKIRAISAQARDRNLKVYTHLYQYVPTTAGVTDFLPSFSSKFVRPLTQLYVRYDVANGPQHNGYKPKYIV